MCKISNLLMWYDLLLFSAYDSLSDPNGSGPTHSIMIQTRTAFRISGESMFIGDLETTSFSTFCFNWHRKELWHFNIYQSNTTFKLANKIHSVISFTKCSTWTIWASQKKLVCQKYIKTGPERMSAVGEQMWRIPKYMLVPWFVKLSCI